MAVPYDYYRIFYYVAQHKSFTKAAEALGNNQPNITRCMNNLEQDLGCKLFVRTNHGVSLTPEGQRLYSRAAVAFWTALTRFTGGIRGSTCVSPTIPPPAPWKGCCGDRWTARRSPRPVR